MELLQTLQIQIESLKANPSDVNIDQLTDILSQAYELARDGLDRSQSAAKFLDAQKRILKLEPQVTSLEEKNTTLTAENKQVKENLEAIESFIKYSRECVLGKVELIKSLSREMKESYATKISAAGGENLVDLIRDIENRFSAEFKESDRILQSTDKTFVNQELYKT